MNKEIKFNIYLEQFICDVTVCGTFYKSSAGHVNSDGFKVEPDEEDDFVIEKIITEHDEEIYIDDLSLDSMFDICDHGIQIFYDFHQTRSDN